MIAENPPDDCDNHGAGWGILDEDYSVTKTVSPSQSLEKTSIHPFPPLRLARFVARMISLYAPNLPRPTQM